MNLRGTLKSFLLGGALFAFTLISAASGQNVALNKPIIDGSGAWPNEGYAAGSFPAQQVTDGGTSEPNDGALTYWLGREGDVTEHFTLDLLEVFAIDEIVLFNTHNRQFNDRMTDEFIIYGSTAVDGSNQLVAPQVVLSANLSNVAGQADIVPDVFNTSNGLIPGISARYLRFETLSAQPGLTNVGLNEIQVYDFSFVEPNLALGKTIIDGSGSWDGGVPGVGAPFNGGSFPASATINGSLAESGSNYWLGREQVPQEYFTLDLHGVEHIEEIRLFNSHNDGSNDRGTKHFRILASDTVDGSNQLVNPIVILDGKLANSAGLSPSQEAVFTAANGLVATNARYLRFEALDSHYDINSVGLNEIEVYATPMHAPTPLVRDDNVAAGKPIIDGSGSWDGGGQCVGAPFNGGTFPASRVVDESMADANTGRTSYWLGREYCNNEYFTIDLGALYNVNEIELLNTHNTQYNDRGTDEFVIYGATEVDGSNQLVDPFVLVSSNLQRTDGQSVLTPESFTAESGLLSGQARYIKFVALTYHSSATNGSSGLNDIRIYGTVVPEPSTLVLASLGAVLGGFAAMRRRGRRD